MMAVNTGSDSSTKDSANGRTTVFGHQGAVPHLASLPRFNPHCQESTGDFLPGLLPAFSCVKCTGYGP